MVIETKKIITILDTELVSQSKRLQVMIKEKVENKVVYGNEEDAKSVIFTDDGIYYSPLSTLTLKKKDGLYQSIS